MGWYPSGMGVSLWDGIPVALGCVPMGWHPSCMGVSLWDGILVEWECPWYPSGM